MRLLALLAVMGAVGTAAAQIPPAQPLVPLIPPTNIPADPLPTEAEVILAQVPRNLDVGQQHTFGAQVQFGYPSGLRLQYTAIRYEQTSILLEAFAGARTALWGDEGVYGLGARSLFTIVSDGEKNALMFGPGISFSYWQAESHHWDYWGYRSRETDQTYLLFDANIGWLHELSPSVGWEIGLNFGALVGLSGRESCGCKVSGKVTSGTIGIYTGFRF
ncbi:hypothetical protein [Zavarzinella formosa]|uniref:hypothetical protein n=1 Tax=Zavarzinella formosa TaxID=360055 RepID=UPI0012F81D8A|nr:hypothetical protein [Zavarzinella formosa]